MTASMLVLFVPTHVDAATKPVKAKIEKASPQISVEAKAMLVRLDEINLMDKSKLTPAEKKELRTEVKAIKSDLKDQQLNSSGGVYLSAGALILIILLLIILL